MSRALRSAFFRLFRTGLWLKTIIFSVLVGLVVANFMYGQIYVSYIFSRPRFIDNLFVIQCLYGLLYVMPFAIAIFCMMFTGTDIAYRAINNKISTGISRFRLYFADLMVSLLNSLISCVIAVATIIAFAKLWAIKSDIRFDSYLISCFIKVILVCFAFTSLYILAQFFCSNKFLALVISLMLIPCAMTTTMLIGTELNEPYRYVVGAEDGESYWWEYNPHYVGGTRRKIYTFLYESSPYVDFYTSDRKDQANEIMAAGMVFVISTAAGFASIRKKEFP
ncbi:MAG: hypothetical protein K5665_07255 [Saccharofermentans sp.]|nr:hypothetical protein [Saccharofermentans sp.]